MNNEDSWNTAPWYQQGEEDMQRFKFQRSCTLYVRVLV